MGCSNSPPRLAWKRHLLLRKGPLLQASRWYSPDGVNHCNRWGSPAYWLRNVMSVLPEIPTSHWWCCQTPRLLLVMVFMQPGYFGTLLGLSLAGDFMSKIAKSISNRWPSAVFSIECLFRKLWSAHLQKWLCREQVDKTHWGSTLPCILF